MGPRVLLSALLAMGVLLGATAAPALTQEQNLAAAPDEPRCPADTPFSIGGESFGSGDVALVEAQFDDSGMPVIVIDFSDQGHARFMALQEGRVGETLPICLGDTLVFAPYLAAPITGSSLQIAGAATAPDTMDLARRIREQLFTGHVPKGEGGG